MKPWMGWGKSVTAEPSPGTEGILLSQRVRFLLPLLVMIAPILLYLSYIHLYGVNLIFMDEWGIVPLIDKLHRGNLTFADLWVQSNDHRMVIPRLLALVLARTTHLNTKYEMYAGALLLIGAYAIFCVLYRKTGGEGLWPLVPTAFLFFSLAQYEDMIWGFQVAWYIVLFCFISALFALEYLVTRHAIARNSALLVALGLSTIASFSLLQGLFVWPCGLFYIIGRRLGREYGILWCLAGILVGTLYFLGFEFGTAGGPSILYFIRHPVASGEYFFVALGSVVMLPSVSAAGVIGMLILAISVFIIISWINSPNISASASLSSVLIIFGLIFDAALVVGRSGFGIGQAAAPRYTLYGLILFVGCYLGLVSLMRETENAKHSLHKVLLGVFSALLILQVAISYRVGLLAGQGYYRFGMMAADVLVNYRLASDELISAYLVRCCPAKLRQLAPIAEAYRLSVFSEPIAETYREAGIVPGGIPGRTLTIPPALQEFLSRDSMARRAWTVLSTLYYQSEYLRRTFPEGSEDFSKALLTWATTSGITVDGAKDFLLPYDRELEIMHELLST